MEFLTNKFQYPEIKTQSSQIISNIIKTKHTQNKIKKDNSKEISTKGKLLSN